MTCGIDAATSCTSATRAGRSAITATVVTRHGAGARSAPPCPSDRRAASTNRPALGGRGAWRAIGAATPAGACTGLTGRPDPRPTTVTDAPLAAGSNVDLTHIPTDELGITQEINSCSKGHTWSPYLKRWLLARKFGPAATSVAEQRHNASAVGGSSRKLPVLSGIRPDISPISPLGDSAPL